MSLSTVTRKVAQLRRGSARGARGRLPRPGVASGRGAGRFRAGSTSGSGARCRACAGSCWISRIRTSARASLCPGRTLSARARRFATSSSGWAACRRGSCPHDAAGVGRRMFERVRLTRLFQSFQAHYGFEYVFCNAYAGHEKGGVESRVGAVRRKLFVPVPSVWSMPAFNARLLERCLALGDKDHYRKGGRETDLFAEDRKALLALPETRFDVAAWKRMKADKYGIVTVEGRHRYAAGPEHAGREPVVGLRAFEARAASMPPGPASRRIRAPTATTPPAASGPSRGSGCRGDRPGAWPNSQVREALPDPLREWLDGQARAVLAEGLRTPSAGRTRERMGERGGRDGRDPRDHRRHRPRRRMPGRGPTRRRDRARRLRRARRPDADTTWRSPGGRTTHEPEERGAHGHRPAAGEGPRPVHLPGHHRRPAGMGHAQAAPGRRQAAAHGTGATARPRSAPGSCAAPGSPSPRRWTATTSRT